MREPFTGSSLPGPLGLGMSYQGTSVLVSHKSQRPEHSLGAPEDFLLHVSVGDPKGAGSHSIPSRGIQLVPVMGSTVV